MRYFGIGWKLYAIALHQLPYHSGDFPQDAAFTRLEEQYLTVANRYQRDELTAIAKLGAIVTLALQNSCCDFLGDIAQENGFLNERAGQFFTPYPLSRLLAQSNLNDVAVLAQEKGIITISDPACGAGGMLIAAAEEIYHQQIDPRQVAQFEAIDIDRDCFNMTYIQLACLDLQAIVRHGNTLSLKMWEQRPTPQLRYFEQWLEERRSWARLERLKELLTEPFTLAKTNTPPESPQSAEAPPPKTPVPQKRQPDVILDAKQLNLFDWQTEKT